MASNGGKHRIGLIGCGGIAGAWVKAVADHPDCRITLTFDLAREAAERRAQETGGRIAATVEALIGSPEVDLVIIATPTPSHPALTLQAAQAGKHVLCEKPMALSLQACEGMIEGCRQAGVKLAVGHSLRFWTAFRACRGLVAAGAIGAPVCGSIDRMGASGVQRAAEAGSGQQEHWRSTVANYGGMALEGFVHELDFTRSIFGEVASVSCEITGGTSYDGLLSPQVLHALVGFESGAMATLRTGSTVAMPTMGYWLAGTEGGLRFTDWAGPVEHYRHDRTGREEITCEPTFAYSLELIDLLTAIETGGEPENSAVNGRQNIALALGMYRAFETGRRLLYRAGVPLDLPADYRNTRYY